MGILINGLLMLATALEDTMRRKHLPRILPPFVGPSVGLRTEQKDGLHERGQLHSALKVPGGSSLTVNSALFMLKCSPKHRDELFGTMLKPQEPQRMEILGMRASLTCRECSTRYLDA